MSDDGSGDHTSMVAERLRAWAREDFGVELPAVDRVGYGADIESEVWRGVSVDGARYAVKLSGGGTPAGLIVSAHLAGHGVPGVVAPATTRSGRLWSEREGRRLSVLPWVSDDRALSGTMTSQHWTSYGALLAQVHATSVTDTLAKLLPREDHMHARSASAVRELDRQVRMAADKPGLERSADQLVRALGREWLAAASLIPSLLQRADDLGRRLRTRQAPNVVCHGDPHLGNVLTGPGGNVWLIDWDDAVLAPRERDLMFVVGGVLAFAPVRPEEQSWFFDGYRPADLDPDRLAYYRCARALEDLAGPAEEVLDVGGRTQPERADALSILRGVLSPSGLVRLALSSVG